MRFFNGLILYPLLEKLSKRNIKIKLLELQKFDALSAQEQLAQQKDILIKTVQYAKAYVPYYRDLLNSQSFDPEKLHQDLNYLKDIPILTKEIVREQGDRLRIPTAYHPRKTGGSTGQSAWFYYDEEGLDWTAAINLRSYEYAGKKPYHVDCHISAELGLKPILLKHKVQQYLKLMAMNRRVLMVSSFSNHDMKKVYQDLKYFRPYLLQGHPSTAYAIANFIEKHNLKIRKMCDIFEPSGEMLTEKMVQSIEQYLNCKVVNRYGNAEFGVVAHTTHPHDFKKLKVFRRSFFIEDCDNSNLIITNLTNTGMPLLRYDTGDVATAKTEADGQFIYNIMGRVHDSVSINQSSYPTHFIMDYLDHKVGRVRQFQVILKPNKTPLLNIVPEDPSDTDRIKNLVLTKWPQGLEVQFVTFDQLITQGWRNKFKYVVDQRDSKP